MNLYTDSDKFLRNVGIQMCSMVRQRVNNYQLAHVHNIVVNAIVHQCSPQAPSAERPTLSSLFYSLSLVWKGNQIDVVTNSAHTTPTRPAFYSLPALYRMYNIKLNVFDVSIYTDN